MVRKITYTSISPLASISPSAIIDGPVIIESGVKIMEHAKISGPTYIGKSVVIGNCALVRGSFISDNCVIGYLVDVARSYIGSSCWFSRVHIADSLLCSEVNIGGGTVIASLRLDNSPVFVKFNGEKISTGRIKFGAVIGDKTQIGANSTIMPGILIGKHCIVGPGSIVSHNLDDNTYCRVDQRLVCQPNVISYNNGPRQGFKKILILE